MITPSTLHMLTCTTGRTQHALQRGSEGKRLLLHCHAYEGKPMAISAACSVCSLEILLEFLWPSRLCAQYAATCWLTLLATVRLAMVDKGPLWDGARET